MILCESSNPQNQFFCCASSTDFVNALMILACCKNVYSCFCHKLSLSQTLRHWYRALASTRDCGIPVRMVLLPCIYTDSHAGPVPVPHVPVMWAVPWNFPQCTHYFNWETVCVSVCVCAPCCTHSTAANWNKLRTVMGRGIWRGFCNVNTGSSV